MRDEEIHRVLDYLTRQCPANSTDFSSEEVLALALKGIEEVSELNRRTSQLIRETKRGR